MNENKFTGRVQVYRQFRPSYSKEFIEYLYSEAGFTPESNIADIGAGTGIFTKQLLEKGNRVIVVEPNADMLETAKRDLAAFHKCEFMEATAEKTKIEPESVDFITAAQSFHWFDRVLFKCECQRILKAGGRVVLAWNSRDKTQELNKKTEEINKQLCPKFIGFSGGSDENPEAFNDFFKDGTCVMRTFHNELVFNREQFIGRNLSGSYTPLPHDATYKIYTQKLNELFDSYSCDGKIVLRNIVRSFAGQV